VKQGLLTEAEIDVALKRMLRLRFELGLFDPLDKVKAAQVKGLGARQPGAPRAGAEARPESIVLLKNDGVLPFAKDPARIAVVGPLADNRRVLLGNYNGWPSRSTTALDGIGSSSRRRASCSSRHDLPASRRPRAGLGALHPEGPPGLEAEVFEKPDFSGTPAETRTDRRSSSDASARRPAAELRRAASARRGPRAGPASSRPP